MGRTKGNDPKTWIRNFKELDIRLLELFARESVTKLPEPCLERVAARVLSEHDHAPWNTDPVR